MKLVLPLAGLFLLGLAIWAYRQFMGN